MSARHLLAFRLLQDVRNEYGALGIRAGSPQRGMNLRPHLRGLCIPVHLLGWLALLASLVPVGQRLWWALELPGHFRMQLFLCLTLVGVVMLGCRRAVSVAVFTAGALLNAAFWAPLYLPGPEQVTAFAPDMQVRAAAAAPALQRASAQAGAPATPAAGFRLVTFNVNQVSGDPAAVHAYLAQEDFDVVILLEYGRRMARALADLPYAFRLERAREDSFGIALLSRLPVTNAQALQLDAVGVPSIRAELAVAGRSVHLLATHPLPPVSADYRASRDRQLAALVHALPAAEAVVLAGDLNATPWSPQVRRLRRESGLLDSARGFGVQPTWPAPLAPLWIPIDHVLHSHALVVTHHGTGPACGSDHFPVEVSFLLRTGDGAGAE